MAMKCNPRATFLISTFCGEAAAERVFFSMPDSPMRKKQAYRLTEGFSSTTFFVWSAGCPYTDGRLDEGPPLKRNETL
jgi:hypothetical protein